MLFNKRTTHLIKVGEEVNQLDIIFKRLNQQSTEDLNHLLAIITNLIIATINYYYRLYCSNYLNNNVLTNFSNWYFNFLKTAVLTKDEYKRAHKDIAYCLPQEQHMATGIVSSVEMKKSLRKKSAKAFFVLPLLDLNQGPPD